MDPQRNATDFWTQHTYENIYKDNKNSLVVKTDVFLVITVRFRCFKIQTKLLQILSWLFIWSTWIGSPKLLLAHYRKFYDCGTCRNQLVTVYMERLQNVLMKNVYDVKDIHLNNNGKFLGFSIYITRVNFSCLENGLRFGGLLIFSWYWPSCRLELVNTGCETYGKYSA